MGNQRPSLNQSPSHKKKHRPLHQRLQRNAAIMQDVPPTELPLATQRDLGVPLQHNHVTVAVEFCAQACRCCRKSVQSGASSCTGQGILATCYSRPARNSTGLKRFTGWKFSRTMSSDHKILHISALGSKPRALDKGVHWCFSSTCGAYI